MNNKKITRISIPADSFKQELREIKTRQKARKNEQKSKLIKLTIKELLVKVIQGQSDIQENLARFENKLNKIKTER